MKTAVDDTCLTTFKDFKFRNIASRFIVYKIDHERIVLETVGEKSQTWTSFISKLPPKQYRYCVFDVEFTNHDNMNVSKIFFCNWSPDAAPLKQRMLYATGKENFKTLLDLNGKEITLNSADDMNEQQLIKEFDK